MLNVHFAGLKLNHLRVCVCVLVNQVKVCQEEEEEDMLFCTHIEWHFSRPRRNESNIDNYECLGTRICTCQDATFVHLSRRELNNNDDDKSNWLWCRGQKLLVVCWSHLSVSLKMSLLKCLFVCVLKLLAINRETSDKNGPTRRITILNTHTHTQSHKQNCTLVLCNRTRAIRLVGDKLAWMDSCYVTWTLNLCVCVCFPVGHTSVTVSRL